MNVIVKPDFLVQLETIFGALLYLIGVAGSYYRFERYKRRGKVDALLMICITWGYCVVMVAVISILKYIFVPTLHLGIIRMLYYSGAFASSLIFFAKDFGASAKQSKIATCFLLGAMVFVVAEVLVFYLELPYQAAIFACVGVLTIYFANLTQRKNLIASLAGLGMIALPIYPKFKEHKFDIQKMSEKREIAIQNLLENKPLNAVDTSEEDSVL